MNDNNKRLYIDLDIDPINIKDVLLKPDKEQWNGAMHDEFEALKANGTWELVLRPKDRDVIDTK